MKLLILWMLTFLPLTATPERSYKTNETYLGSNTQSYATFITEVDNQGSYYESREIKKLIEYSKKDGKVISSKTISDILYTIDANHNNPNTLPKVTRTILKEDKAVSLSTILTKFHLPLTPITKPTWIKRLSWNKGNLVLDKKLQLLNKDVFTQLKISQDVVREEPLKKSILQVFSDAESMYLLFKVNTDTDHNTHILHLPANITKQLRDRINLLKKYVFIKSYKTLNAANQSGLEMIKNSQTKNFYGLNPEIWLRKKGNQQEYLLLHRPLEIPLDPEHIKRLDAAIGINTSTVKSNHFIEKWIPYDSTPKAKQPDHEPEEHDPNPPEDLLDRSVDSDQSI